MWVISKFIFARMRERIQHQLGNVPVRDRIVPMLSFPPAGDQPSVAEPSEPFRGCRGPFAHRIREIANTGALPAQHFQQSQPAFIRDRSQHANGTLEISIVEVWLRQRMVGAIIFRVLLPEVIGSWSALHFNVL